MAQDLYNPPSGSTPGAKSLPAGWTPVFWPASQADQARVQNQAVQDIPPSQGTIQTASVSSQRSNNAPVSVKTDTSVMEWLDTNKSLYDMSEKDLKNNMWQLGVNIAKTTERNVIEEIQATMGGTTAFDKDINKLMYEKNRIRPMMMSTINEYTDPYEREKLIAMEEKRIEDKIVEVQAQKQSRLGTIDMALKAALEDKQNDLNAAAKLYDVYKNEVWDRREAEKLKLSMQSLMLDIEKTKQEIAFNNAAMPYKIEQLKTEGNSMSRNPTTGEMEVYDRYGNRVDNQLPPQSQAILSQNDGYLPTDGKYRQDKWGWYECGEGANKLTWMSSTPGGNDKSSRKAAYKDATPVQMGQVFFDWPGFDRTYGHIETVTSFDPTTGTFTTKGFNKNNDGRLTTSTYSLEQLKKSGVHVGFYNDTPAAKKIGQVSWGNATSNIERMITRSSYTEQEKQQIRADIKKNNLSDEEAQSIYFAPKNYAEAVTQLTLTGKETWQDLIKEIGIMASMFPEQGKWKVVQTYIAKLWDNAPTLASELIQNGTYYYVDDKDKAHLADLSNDDDLYDGVWQLLQDIWEKKAREVLQKLTEKDGYKSGWFNDDKWYDTIQQAFEDAGYEF